MYNLWNKKQVFKERDVEVVMWQPSVLCKSLSEVLSSWAAETTSLKNESWHSCSMGDEFLFWSFPAHRYSRGSAHIVRSWHNQKSTLFLLLFLRKEVVDRGLTLFSVAVFARKMLELFCNWNFSRWDVCLVVFTAQLRFYEKATVWQTTVLGPCVVT